MQIGKENIESFIFDYHEGNLTDSEKTEVLNYIHNHPEYEVEFTLWAQSYLPYENTIENYDITHQLLQPSPTLWHNKSWIKITAPLLLCAVVSFFYFTSHESTVSSDTQHTNPTEEHPIGKEQINTNAKINNISIKNTKTTLPYISTTSSISNNSTLQNQQTADTSITTMHIENTAPTTVHSATDIEEKKTTTSDSVTNNSNTLDPNGKTNTSKKRKPYKIQPATDFIPTNPDF